MKGNVDTKNIPAFLFCEIFLLIFKYDKAIQEILGKRHCLQFFAAIEPLGFEASYEKYGFYPHVWA